MTNMKRIAAAGTVALVVVVGAGRLSAQSGYDLFQKGLAAERADGNLKAAIALYERVVKEFASDRALAAKALIRMAECHEKLGEAESKNIYERIVRDFSDQKEEVALARGHLGSTATVASMKRDRLVWDTPHTFFARVSPDGRSITYVDGDDGRLMIHDVAMNTDRALTPAAVPTYSQQANQSVISRDGRQLVYVWAENPPTHPYRLGLRIAALPMAGFLLEPRQFFLANDDVRSFVGFDWSSDRQWVAAALKRRDGTGQIVLIAMTDGSIRVLKSVMDGNGLNGIFFSPDSRYIVYDLPGGDGSTTRDVFVSPMDGSREMPAVIHGAHRVMGWSPDGTRLLFSSDRTGSLGLWTLPFADGKPQGAVELLRSDIGSDDSLGLTASGALYVSKQRINTRDIAIAPIDLQAGRLLGPPVGFTQGFVNGAGGPRWSLDGKYLAYPAACQNHRQCIAIRSVATGQVRLSSPLVRVGDPRWSPDGLSIVTRGADLMGRNGHFQFDARTGELTVATLLSSDESGRGEQVQWSQDGRVKAYLNRGGVFFERDLASGSEREINRVPGLIGTGPLSPDGKYFSPILRDPSTKTERLLLVPADGSPPRELLRLTQPELFSAAAGGRPTPDSSAVMFVKDIGSRKELWLIPVSGGRPRKLDIDPNLWMEGAGDAAGQYFSLSQDGRSMAFQVGKVASAEVWALENFLPPSSTKKQ